MSETKCASKYLFHSNLHRSTVKKRNKLALSLFDDKRMYLNTLTTLPRDKHTAKGDCHCILCVKDTGRKVNHHEHLKLISDRLHLPK